MNANNSNHFRNRSVVLALSGALIAGGAAVALSSEIEKSSNSAHPSVTLPLDENSVPRDTLPQGSFAPVVKKVAPAVVKIETTTTVKTPPGQDFPAPNDPFWQQFFGQQFHQMVPRQQRPSHDTAWVPASS